MLTPDEFTIVKAERDRLANDLRQAATGARPDMDEEDIVVLSLALRGLDSLIEEYSGSLAN